MWSTRGIHFLSTYLDSFFLIFYSLIEFINPKISNFLSHIIVASLIERVFFSSKLLHLKSLVSPQLPVGLGSMWKERVVDCQVFHLLLVQLVSKRMPGMS